MNTSNNRLSTTVDSITSSVRRVFIDLIRQVYVDGNLDWPTDISNFNGRPEEIIAALDTLQYSNFIHKIPACTPLEVDGICITITGLSWLRSETVVD